MNEDRIDYFFLCLEKNLKTFRDLMPALLKTLDEYKAVYLVDNTKEPKPLSIKPTLFNSYDLLKMNVIGQFLNDYEPTELLVLISCANSDAGILELQDYISDHLQPQFQWMTAISLIEATQLLVKDAIPNGNIE